MGEQIVSKLNAFFFSQPLQIMNGPPTGNNKMFICGSWSQIPSHADAVKLKGLVHDISLKCLTVTVSEFTLLQHI